MAESAAVIDRREKSRFELAAGNDIAIAAYRRQDDAIVFTHTEVPAALEGQGIGGALIRGALERVRAEGLRVVPECSFVAAYIDRHPEQRDLVDG